MSEKFIHDVREKVIKMEKISQIQETLQNMATLMVGYPDASEDQSKRWLDTLNVCRVELRRRHQSSQVRLAPKTGGD
jgi:allophanate hydrolase subunit 1